MSNDDQDALCKITNAWNRLALPVRQAIMILAESSPSHDSSDNVARPLADLD
jgi:hypothetical protein